MAMTPGKLKAMFTDLGKATKRGVRKCPQCGTINGTRGMQCKNRDCEFIFKEGPTRKNANTPVVMTAVKVVTGSSVQVYSVNTREKGKDFRDFVQLPLIQDLDGNPAENIDPNIIMSVLNSAAKCYVETCPRSKQSTADLSSTLPVCNHIRVSFNCSDNAQPLTLKNSVLNSLDIPSDIKEAIWLLATETSGPLVQRVAKNMFVVKCTPSPKHPLGFLHLAFIPSGDGRKKENTPNKFRCSCNVSKLPKSLVSTEDRKMCVHFYSCISSIASDEVIAEEFPSYVSMTNFKEIVSDGLDTAVVYDKGQSLILKAAGTSVDESAHQELTAFETLDSGHFENIEEDVINEDTEILLESQAAAGDEGPEATLEESDMVSGSSTGSIIISSHPSIVSSEAVITQNPQHSPLGNIEVIVDDNNQILSVSDPPRKRSKLDRVQGLESIALVTESSDTSLASNALLTLQQDSTTETPLTSSTTLLPPQTAGVLDTVLTTSISSHVNSTEFKLLGRKTPVKPALQKSLTKKSTPMSSNSSIDDIGSLQITFLQWLASVTERINQTMHYQFDGCPEPLVFHAPQVFFDSLQARISAGSKKKRLPNATTGFIRKDALPLGTFTKYTWHITNILHAKQIFDTPELSLDITRSFVENKDGTFDLYDKSKDPNTPHSSTSEEKSNFLPIRPFELKTYLKVGHTHPNQKEATPFVIEWIPDILPKTRIGELRIKFEYGHQRNGHVEHRMTTLC